MAQNGVNIDGLLAAREALRSAPEAANFTWRASCRWKSGTHAKSTVQGFHGLGGEQSHKSEFSFETDHPEIFASEDKGATPVELVPESAPYVVFVDGISKAFAATGVRVGWGVGPRAVIAATCSPRPA